MPGNCIIETMNWFGIITLAAFAVFQAMEYWLTTLNIRHMRSNSGRIPPGFERMIDEAVMQKSVAYAADRSALASAESLLTAVVVIALLAGNVLGDYDSWVKSLHLPFVPSGVVFFLLLAWGNMLLSIPFSLYGTFRIEQRYGFNTMTIRLWLADLAKGAILSAVLLGIVLSGGFFLVQLYPVHWWLPVWCFLLVFSVVIMYVAPYVIEPLFNKYRPVDEALQTRIREMMQKAGIRVSRVFTMDASRRSTHANAYFTGIGRVKRIVLFDTLLKGLSEDEVLSVLAHEAGHWKRHHVLKRMAVFELVSLAVLYAASRILQPDSLSQAFGIHEGTFFAKALILGFIAGIAGVPLTPAMSWLSRRHEYEADRFATALAPEPAALASGLIKLSRDNLSNLHPHPLYAAWYYSHPPVVQRVENLNRLVRNNLANAPEEHKL